MSEVLDVLLGRRYSTLKLSKGKEYRFDKLIFISIVVLLLGFSLFMLNSNGWDKTNKLYLNCPNARCFNPFYNNSDVCGPIVSSNDFFCTQQIVDKGEYGIPPPWYIKDSIFLMSGIVLIFFGLILNHFINNIGTMKDVSHFLDDLDKNLKGVPDVPAA